MFKNKTYRYYDLVVNMIVFGSSELSDYALQFGVLPE